MGATGCARPRPHSLKESHAYQAHRSAGPLPQSRHVLHVGSARRARITGRLPSAVETLDEQAARTWGQLQQLSSDLRKYLYLNEVHNRNQVLYFKLLDDHLIQLLPIVYDPTGGRCHRAASSSNYSCLLLLLW